MESKDNIYYCILLVGQLSASITRLADQWLASQLPTLWLSELIIACFSERGYFRRQVCVLGPPKPVSFSGREKPRSGNLLTQPACH